MSWITRALSRSDNPIAGAIFYYTQRSWKIGGLRFLYPRRSLPMGYYSRFLFNLYEKSERNLVLKYVSGTDAVLEIGAGIGVISCITNKVLADPKKHVVVEANENLIELLCRNREINECHFKVITGMVTENEKATFSAGTVFTMGRAEAGTEGVKEVSTIGLVDVQAEIGNASVLIIDIEGSEVSFFQEYCGSLSSVNTLILEEHPKILGAVSIQNLRSLLNADGFSVVERVGQVSVWKRRATI